jgi:hypothetical protein
LDTEGIPNQFENITKIRLFGVDYQHLKLRGGDDLYVTQYGMSCIDNLLPENFWTDEAWFQNHSRRLRGTSTVYKVTTKEVAGRSKDIVIKWNRMGQDIPGSIDLKELNVEFNSPFEEFALVTEFRDINHESEGRIFTHKPLAIYVPMTHIDLERLGRKTYKMEAIISSHNGIELDIFRNYAVIYEWIKGIDAVQAFEQKFISENDMARLTLQSEQEAKRKGFMVGDSKPHHIIVRPNKDGKLARDRNGQILYAMVDFELLKRTPERERQVRKSKRQAYLEKQVHRFDVREPLDFPPNLKPVLIMGVDYVYGLVEETGGALWVVGKDPALFDYFLPEKWRETPRTKQSVFDQVYRTITKDNIQLVWKVSRVGELPDIDPFNEDENKILEYGYNSPFEEVALAIELNNIGVQTTYPRAIYMAASRSEMDESLCDDKRYKSHAHLVTPDGKSILRKNHDYIIFWGYWNGPDEVLAVRDESPCHGIDALLAYRKGFIDKEMYLKLMELTREKLTSIGIEDLNLRGKHILLSVDNSRRLVKNSDNIPEIRISNFELLKKSKT